jgi:hypothetical protein
MSEATLSAGAQAETAEKKKTGQSTLSRVARYTVVRLVTLFLTVVVSVYLTILIANMGGFAKVTSIMVPYYCEPAARTPTSC